MKELKGHPRTRKRTCSTSNSKALTHLIEISLKKKLLENIDEFGEGGEELLEELDELRGADAVVHVVADVHLDVGLAVRHFDDGDLKDSLEKLLTQIHYNRTSVFILEKN